MDETVFIREKNVIKEVNYRELVSEFVEKIKTPRGVEPKLHVREVTWFQVNDDFYEKEYQAKNAADDLEKDTGIRPSIKEIARYEGWTWGDQGNSPERLKVFDTNQEAEDWLFECAEIDFQDDSDAPFVYATKQEAEEDLRQKEPDNDE
jgi:hypothetical protein